jgi:glycosyltransferase involved in cell wall biosynthesis
MNRPKILFIVDVYGWAWYLKSLHIKNFLSDEFDIDIIWVLGKGAIKTIPTIYDAYLTYGYSYIDKLSNIPRNKKSTGVTAHRPKSQIISQMKKAKYVHANSVLLHNELIMWGLEKVYYLPNGVNEKLFTPLNPIPVNDELVIGHVGKLSPQKGQKEYIIPAIKKSKVKQLLHFNKYVDAIPHHKMVNIHNSYDVFICASKEDGTPNGALEAAACGRPILSNRIGNMPEFIEDGVNGFLIEKTVKSYVEKIEWFRSHKEEMREMGKNARKTIEDGWTWKIQSERYRKMFWDMVNDN